MLLCVPIFGMGGVADNWGRIWGRHCGSDNCCGDMWGRNCGSHIFVAENVGSVCGNIKLVAETVVESRVK